MKPLFALSVLLLLAAAAKGIEELAPPAGPGATAPFVFATRDAILVSWLEPVAGTDRVALRFSRFANNAWTAPRTIVERNDLVVNWADFPSIVADSSGVLFAHWPQTSGKSVYACDVRMSASKDNGATWRAPFLLNRDGKKNEHGFVSLVPLPGGGVGATWLDGRNMVEGKEEGEMSIRYASVDARGDVRSEVALDTRTCECCATGMAMAKSGPVIVYRDRRADDVRDIVAVRRTANGWTAPRLVHADGWKIAGCPVNGPQVDAIGDRVAVAWFTAAREQGRAFVAFSDDAGASFASPVRIDDGKPVGRVAVVMLDPQTALVTWIEQTAAGAEIRARRVARAGSTSPSMRIADSSTARAAGFPRIARLNGDVYFAWTEQSGTTRRIHVARVTAPPLQAP